MSVLQELTIYLLYIIQKPLTLLMTYIKMIVSLLNKLIIHGKRKNNPTFLKLI